MIFKSIKVVVRLAVAAVALGVFMMLAAEAPQVHGTYIRSKVGSQVFRITNRKGNSGGTGFAVRGDSGKVYTMTNAHVCRIDGGKIYANLANGRKIPLQILEFSEEHDLCIASAVPKLKGLKLASSVAVGEELGVVGHPKLMPLTLSRGELIGYQNVIVLVDEQECDDTEQGAAYKTVLSLFGPVCILDVEGALSNILILPGNSGSPVVNFWGNITAVAFAADARDGWGILVPLKYVKAFLRNY